MRASSSGESAGAFGRIAPVVKDDFVKSRALRHICGRTLRRTGIRGRFQNCLLLPKQRQKPPGLPEIKVTIMWTIAKRIKINTILIGFCALIVGYFIWAELQGQKESAYSVTCRQHMKQLSDALLQYANDWDEHLPPSKSWSTCINSEKYLHENNRTIVFHCPAAKTPYGYAMNYSVGGMSLSSFDIRHTVLVFETDSENWDANGSAEYLAHSRHHMLNCSFCDGNVVWVNTYTRNNWIWSVTNIR